MGADARIVIAERWSVLRRGLIGVLHGVHTVVDHFDDVTELPAVVRRRPVDLAIVGDADDIDLVAVIGAVTHPGPAPDGDGPPSLVVLTDDVEVAHLRAVLRAGARAVLSKRVDDIALLDAIARVLDGDRVIDQRYLPLLFGESDLVGGEGEGRGLLTPRERDVLVHLAKGETNRQIASALVVGESTVKTHLGRIYAKLEVESRHHAVGRALELGLLS